MMLFLTRNHHTLDGIQLLKNVKGLGTLVETQGVFDEIFEELGRGKALKIKCVRLGLKLTLISG